MKKYFTLVNIIIGFCLVVLDLFIYLILGLLFMNYEDHFDGTKGEFLSLESMTSADVMVYIGIILWHLVNLFVLSFIIYKVVKIVSLNKTISNK